VIVIDSSALAKYLLREVNWALVEGFLAKGLYTVNHALKEVSNAIWKHAVVRKRIPGKLGLKVYEQLKRLVDGRVLILEEEDKYLDKAVNIAMRYGITVYDSLYIAQALKLGELVTSDRKQAEVARKMGVKTHYIE